MTSGIIGWFAIIVWRILYEEFRNGTNLQRGIAGSWTLGQPNNQ